MRNPNLLRQLEELEATIVELRFQAEEGYDDMVRLTLTFLRHQVEILERVYNSPAVEDLQKQGFYNEPDGGRKDHSKSMRIIRDASTGELDTFTKEMTKFLEAFEKRIKQS